MAGLLQGMQNIDRPGVSTEEKVTELSRYMFALVDTLNRLSTTVQMYEERLDYLESITGTHKEV